MGNIYRLAELNARHREHQRKLSSIKWVISAKFHDQEKQVTLYKVSAHKGIKGNEEADRTAKQAIDIPRMTMTSLPHTGNGSGKTVLVSYTKLNQTSKSEKYPQQL